MKKIFVIVPFLSIIFFSTSASYCQMNELKAIDREYEDCFAKGENMYVCSQVYYSKIDSMLTVVYKLLYSKLDEEGKETLKQNQLKWQKKKNKDFKKIDASIDPDGGYDELMIALDKKAEILHKRIEYLIVWLDKIN